MCVAAATMRGMGNGGQEQLRKGQRASQDRTAHHDLTDHVTAVKTAIPAVSLHLVTLYLKVHNNGG